MSSPARARRQRILVAGWFSFPDGEATAGDVACATAVCAALDAAGMEHEAAWSPAFRPGALTLAEAEPSRYSHVVFVCGPLRGVQINRLHDRYARCVRMAVGVSVIDPRDPAVEGFHTVIARDRPGAPPRPDLAYTAPRSAALPVVGVAVAPGQREYGRRRRHEEVHRIVAEWLAAKDFARVSVDTRLDTRDWRHCATIAQFDSLVARLDALITTRLHGLVFALRNGIPALAVDPVAGGAKVAAQAQARGWPVVTAREGDPPLEAAELEAAWRRCLSRTAAAPRAPDPAAPPGIAELLSALRE